MKLLSKRAQISLEFSILLLAILVMSSATIYYFIHNNFNEKNKTLDKIDIGAKTAVSLVNSGYNGTHTDYPIIYLGMKYDANKTNIVIYIKNRSSVNNPTKNFIIDYIINSQNINSSKYNISIKYIN
ncbi:class III signal peptide-containing protein [Methanothermococcus sp.]|uniref:class III signal peptide-containing protein n=1 Tax=Methanothermococcus sp. TaxID=2614238 RepID=UPI0025E760E9|nr:class III signal peptide-containing protein [Methanothermococcus sp.]